MRYCIIENGYIVNTIVWDGVEPWEPPAGALVLPESEAMASYEYLPLEVLNGDN
jgi:hypothetical protein